MPDVEVASRKRQYIIGRSDRLLPAGATPTSFDQLKQALDRNPEIDLHKVIAPPATVRAFTVEETHPESVMVVSMRDEHAEALKNTYQDLQVELDAFLYPMLAPPVVREPTISPANQLSFSAPITIRGKDDKPVAGAHVSLFGAFLPTQGVTDENGQVTLSLFGESGQRLQGLHVEPNADHWNLWISQPVLDPAQNNIVRLHSLDQDEFGLHNFPNQQCIGWGQRAMNLDKLPPEYTGRGVRIGVIDSGVATSHRDLQGQVQGGFDFVNDNAETWNQDQGFHGTHCTGIIAGKNDNQGIRGFAPHAEVYAYKIFPGGRFSDLINALNRCIDQRIDVVNLSLGADPSQRSELVERAIRRAKEQGIACIVAAGNAPVPLQPPASSPVQYPASSPEVLAVAAIGKEGTYPSDSYHSTKVFADQANSLSDGYFVANFSCSGPEVAVCAPGVAILSSVPPDNFAVWDGTSMATPHITGLAALILAHHPDFQTQGPYARRDARRVERLFQIIRQSAHPVASRDRTRVGAGLPDVLVALNLQPAPGLAPGAPTDWQRRLAEILGGIFGQQGMPVSPAPVRPEDIDQAMRQLNELVRQAQLQPAGVGAPSPVDARGIDAERELRQLEMLIRQADLR